MAEDWITTTEAASIINYHPESVRELVREGKVMGRKFGTIWQVSRKNILAYQNNMEKSGKKRGPKPKAVVDK